MTEHRDRAIAYIRVSMEREGMISPELQQAAIETYCAQHHYEIVEELRDIDLSGRFWARRQVERAITMVEFGAAEVIVVARWSRVARNRHDWAIAVDRIESVGGRLESAFEPVDATTSTGRFTRGMLAELAAFESDRYADMWREIRRRRTAAGLTSDGFIRYGYTRHADGSHTPDLTTAPLLTAAYRRYIRGASAAEIAKWLNTLTPPSPMDRSRIRSPFTGSTLLFVMDSGFAAGLLRTSQGLQPGAHPALLTPRQWEQYRSTRAARRHPHEVHVQPDHMLMHGLVYCHCGQRMMSGQTCKLGADYRCYQRDDGSDRRSHCAILGRSLDKAVMTWLHHLVNDVAAGDTARDGSRIASEANWTIARRLARSLSTHETATRQSRLTAAEAHADWVDPVRRATDLLTDWPHLTFDMQRRWLRQLVGRAIVAPARHSKDRVTVLGWWQTPGLELE